MMSENTLINWKIKTQCFISNITSLLVFLCVYTQNGKREILNAQPFSGMLGDHVCLYVSINFKILSMSIYFSMLLFALKNIYVMYDLCRKL